MSRNYTAVIFAAIMLLWTGLARAQSLSVALSCQYTSQTSGCTMTDSGHAIVSGDLLVSFIGGITGATCVSTSFPTGGSNGAWTLMPTLPWWSGGSSGSACAWYRLAAAGDTGGVTFTQSTAGGTPNYAFSGILDITGESQSTPICANGAGDHAASGASPISMPATAITLSSGCSMLWWLGGLDIITGSPPSTITVPAGFTNGFNIVGNATSVAGAAGYKTGVAPGSTGTITGSGVASGSSFSYQAMLFGVNSGVTATPTATATATATATSTATATATATSTPTPFAKLGPCPPGFGYNGINQFPGVIAANDGLCLSPGGIN